MSAEALEEFRPLRAAATAELRMVADRWLSRRYERLTAASREAFHGQ